MTYRRCAFTLLILASLAACGDDGEPEAPLATATSSATVTRPHTVTPTPSATPTWTQLECQHGCGNGFTCHEEQCDDGNNFGGDGCAANCTFEHAVTGACTLSSIAQTGAFAIPLYSLVESFEAALGNTRDREIHTQGGADFAPGDVPFVVRKLGLEFPPVLVPGLVCLCVRTPEHPDLGPGNAGAGIFACGSQGLFDVDVTTSIDHSISDVDPSCSTGTPDSLVPDVCNGRPQIEASRSGPRGSSRLALTTSTYTISDGGSCGEQCIPANGLDCLPCTDDDPDQLPPTLLYFTTGRASAFILDANNSAGHTVDCSESCGPERCICDAAGRPFDCEALQDGVLDGTWVTAFVQLNAPQTGDILVTTTLDCRP